jgi:phosphohistidine phosphatase
MELYILRHGKAGKRGAIELKDDRKRTLTPKGRREMEEIARWMANAGIEPDWIATSPLVRAQETAEIVVEALDAADRLEEWEELAIGYHPDAIIGQLAAKDEGSEGMIVGHEPLLSQTIGHLISSDGSARAVLAKGGLAKIGDLSFRPAATGELVWLMTPKCIMKS